MKKIEPTIYKTKIWKLLEKEYKKAPKFRVAPVDRNSKVDNKKAKLMEQLLNYQYKNNINGFQTKYFALQKKLAELYVNEQLYEITVNWEELEKIVKNFI